ncbi:MAG: hypothetical protein QOC91_1071 [Solirubrobacteraceae bacterium]|jgi:hypothetical protein|nr:hypothetical protein [Solirubrobacteraceae bacterium]
MSRLLHAWRELAREQRLSALTALGLFVSMLLPWYSKTVVEGSHAAQASLSAFQSFSFVEAAVLLVSAGVLAILFARAEERDFHLPGGDGTIVMIAGGWAAVLIFYRMLDKPGLHGAQKFTASVGIQWGIFIALLLALGLVYAGRRMRAGERGQPPLSRPRERPRRRELDAEREETTIRSADDDDRFRSRGADHERDRPTAIVPVPARPPAARAGEAPRPAPPSPRAPRGRPRYPPGPSEQMSFEDAPPGEE